MPGSFPIALDLSGRRCLVVGNGEEAVLRAEALHAAGARVLVVAPTPCAALRALVGSGVMLAEREYTLDDFDEVWLVVLADRDPPLADRLARDTEARRIFYCAVDDPRVGSFSHLAIARAGLVFAAIGTHGEAPALGRRLRELLSDLFERAGLEAFAKRHAELRRRTSSTERKNVLGRDVAALRFEGELVLPTRDPSDE